MLLGESSDQGTSRWYVYEPGTFRPLALLQRNPAPAASGICHHHLDTLARPAR